MSDLLLKEKKESKQKEIKAWQPLIVTKEGAHLEDLKFHTEQECLNACEKFKSNVKKNADRGIVCDCGGRYLREDLLYVQAAPYRGPCKRGA